MKLILYSRKMYPPTEEFKKFLQSSVTHYEVRKKNKPKISDKKDIEDFIKSLDFKARDLVHEERKSYYNKIYYKFWYKELVIYIW